MRLVGYLILALAALVLGVGYKRYLLRGVRLGEGYLAFLRRLENGMSCYAEPYAKAAEGYREGVLLENGFVNAIKEGALLSEAFGMADNTALDGASCELLSELFDGLGMGYLDKELKRIKNGIEALSKTVNESSDRAVKDTRVAFAVIFALLLGIIILFS